MSEIQNMIQSGQFGTNGPIGYNPYNQPNNIIQFGGYQNQEPVFQPIPQQTQQNYYNPYASSYSNRGNPNYYNNNNYNPYGFNYRQNSQYNNYYNPYGYNANPNYYNNNYNPYGYSNNPYAPYGTGSLSEYQRRQQELIELEKVKIKTYNAFYGIKMTEEEIDNIVNPQSAVHTLTEEEIKIKENYDYVNKVDQAAQQQQKVPIEMALFNKTMTDMAEFRKKYDSHSLCEFLNKDSGVIRFNNWIEENCIPRNDRCMKDTYDTNSYNQLLNMHAASSPYTSSLLNQTYDNNKDDYEVGLHAVQDRETKKYTIFCGKVPESVSSKERQQARAKYCQQVLNLMCQKVGDSNV